MSATLDPRSRRPGPRRAARAGRAARLRVPGGRRPDRSSNGLSILVVDLPGRPLVSASLVVTGGAVEEPADTAGATVLAARALTEGTERYDAIALVEAAERLGASLHAEAGWDALTVGVDVPGRPPRARPRAGRRGPPPSRPSRSPRSSASATSG